MDESLYMYQTDNICDNHNCIYPDRTSKLLLGVAAIK